MKKVTFLTFIFLLIVAASFAQKPEAVIKQASVDPIVDGIIDAVWAEANVYNIDKNFQAEVPTLGETGETTWQALWTDDGMYLLVHVTDNDYYPSWITGGANSWQYDRPDIYFDVNYILEDGLGCQGNVNQGHYNFDVAMAADNIDGNRYDINEEKNNLPFVYSYAFLVDDPNYIAEYFFPFNTFITNDGGPIDLTGEIGFDVTITDNDSPGGDDDRQRAVWANIGAINESWANMDDAGIITFEGADPPIYVDQIILTVDGAITQDNETLQVGLEVLPQNATVKTVKWLVSAPNGGLARASISKSGLITPVINEEIIVQAISSDGFVYSNEVNVSIIGQEPTLDEMSYIKDGDFNLGQGTSPSGYWTGSAEIIDGVAVCDVPMIYPDRWGWVLSQTVNVPYELKNENFIFKFKAWADAPRTFTVDFEDPNNSYLRYGVSTDPTSPNGTSDWTFDITTEPTEYTLSCTFENMYPNTIQNMIFMLGLSDVTVYIDSVTLVSEDDLYLIDKKPVAKAGPDQTVFIGDLVTLNGSNSFDGGGNDLTYLWTPPLGISLSSNTMASPTFTAPDVEEDTPFAFSLVVNNGTENSKNDEVIITVEVPEPPCNPQDSLALVAIYNATNGPNWSINDNWLTTVPVKNWYGVTQLNGRIVELNLVLNGLYGYLPVEVGNLTEMKKLHLGNDMFVVQYNIWNNLNQQPLPQTLENLTKLEILSLDYLNMWSELPDVFGGMTALRELYIQDSYFTNLSLPTSIASCTNLERMYIYNNEFYNLPDLSGLNNLSYFDASLCYFSFDDVEPNLSIPDFFYYNQRLLLGTPESLNPVEGETISHTIEVDGENNIYQWLKDGQEIAGQNSNMLTLENVSSEDAGIYTLRVNNSQATQLTLASHPIILYQEQLPVYQALAALYNSTGGDGWHNNANWLSNEPITNWYGINIDTWNGEYYLSLYNNNLVGTLPDEFGDLSIFNRIEIRYNSGLAGEIPSSIGNLTNLRDLYLDRNNLSGNIPVEIGNMTNLVFFHIGFNKITGIPVEITNCSSLSDILAFYNEITDLPDLSGMNNIFRLHVINNKLEFDDIMPMMGNIPVYGYSPQGRYGELVIQPLLIGGSVTFDGSAGGTGNVYQWYKNDQVIQGETGSELVFTSLTANDEGTYTCQVSNPAVPDLTLISEPKSLVDPANQDSYEPDNTFEEASLIQGGDYQQHSLYPAGDVDFVKIEVENTGAFVQMYMDANVWVNQRLALYAEDQLTLISENDYIEEVLEPGIYYVKVYSMDNGVIPEYHLSFNATEINTDAWEPDNTFAEANLIQSNDYQQHSLYPAGDVDFVKFEVENSGAFVQINMMQMSGVVEKFRYLQKIK